MSNPRRIALACVASLLLAACSGEPTPEVADASPTPTAAATTEAAPTPPPAATVAPTPTPTATAQATPEPCPDGQQRLVPGGACFAPAPAATQEPEPEPEPDPEPASEPEPDPEPAPVADPCDRAAKGVSISMIDFAFENGNRSGLCVGDTITFTNNGDISHTGTHRGGAFDTGSVTGGESATVTIAQAGTLKYVCLFHSQMSGTLVVDG